METEPLRYLRDVAPDAKIYRSPVRPDGWGSSYPGQRADGYGRKISTDYVARYGGRTRRVYVCQFSNAGTAYVIDGGRWAIVDDTALWDRPPLPAELRGGIVAR